MKGDKNPNFGKHFTEDSKKKMSQSAQGKHNNEKNGRWKGDIASSSALHDWLRKYKTKSGVCEECGSIEKKLELSFNHLLGDYTRNKEDYRWLCHKCHFNYDFNNIGIKHFGFHRLLNQIQDCPKQVEIKGISFSHRGEAWNLSVEKNHNFILGNGILTHNSTLPYQLGLRSPLEKFEKNCLFIMLLNDLAGIKIPAILSRCALFKCVTPPMEEIAANFLKNAEKVGVKFDPPSLTVAIAKHYKGDMRRMYVDCLEALRGYSNKLITKNDLKDFFGESTQSIAEKVYKSENKLATFAKIWENESFNERQFLQDYFELEKRKAKIFAEIDARLLSGGNPIIQFAYLFGELSQ